MQQNKKKQRPFWKRIFCGCTNDEYQEDKPQQKSKSILSNNQNKHYQKQQPIEILSPNLGDSTLVLHLKKINKTIESPLVFITDNSQQCCFLVNRTKLQVPMHKNLIDYSQHTNQLFEYTGDKKLLYDTQTVKIAPQYLCRYIAGRLYPLNRILEINSQFNQHTIQFIKSGMSVTSVSQNEKHLMMGKHNLEELGLNLKDVSLIQADFSQTKFKPNSFDAIFINLTQYSRDKQNQVYLGLINAFQTCQNIVILLQNKRIDFLLNLLSKMILETPNICASMALEQQDIYINSKIEFTIIYFGVPSKLKRTHLIDALSERLLANGKFYQEYDLTTLVKPFLNNLVENIGCILVMKYFLESLYHLDEGKELVYGFFKELEKQNLVSKDVLDDYSQKYPSTSATSLSPIRKPRKQTTQLPQSLSFTFEQEFKTQTSEFVLDTGTYFSNNQNKQETK